MKCKCHPIIVGVLFASATLATQSLQAATNNAAGANWQIGLRPIWRGNMKVGIDGSSYVQTLGIHATTVSSSSDSSHSSGYHDGFVDSDVSSDQDGMTWNWGYDDADQYDADSETLTFHSSSSSESDSRTLTTVQDDAMGLSDTIQGGGLQVTALRNILRRGDLSLGICAGLQGIWNQQANWTATTFQENIATSSSSSANDYEYVYSTEGAAIPDAPYEGSYYGPGPQISINPTTVRQSSGSSSASSYSAANLVDMNVDSAMYGGLASVRLGYTLFQRLTVFLSPNLSLNYLDISADRTEDFVATYANGTTASLDYWSDSVNAGLWRLNLGCEAGVDVDVYKGWTLGVSAGYDWQTQKAEVDVGPNTVSVDASGYQAGLSVGKLF